MSLLVENQLLALVVIMTVGLLLGRIKIFGFRLGVAAVLFVGLALSTIEPDISVPSLIYVVGLSLFVYTIGLEAGPGFFTSMKTTGLRNNALTLGAIIATTALAWALITVFNIDAASGAGMLTGALTNTPAMAAVVDALPSLIDDTGQLHLIAELPVVAYSLAYPLGVLIVILSIAIFSSVFKVDHNKEAEEAGVAVQELKGRRIRVTVADLPALENIPELLNLHVIVSRVERDGEQFIPLYGEHARIGDVLTVVGADDELNRAEKAIGELIDGDPYSDVELDYRRIFVSNTEVVGTPLSKLQPLFKDMLITRIRRGDTDLVASSDMTLQLGDRVRVVAPAEKLREATQLLGDSYKKLSDFNLLPLAAGLMIGVLVGMVEFPLPGGSSLKLGNAGGPLVVALLLGMINRTGKFVWQIPYGANLALRQLGITLFLAAIGTSAGAGFRSAISDPQSLTIIGFGALLTLFISITVLFVGHKLMKIPFGETAGILAGTQTHPAVLSYVSDASRNELPAMGYTSVYPLAMIAKILAAQTLLFLLI
ncbi:aspartate:alanine exchanger family transporter [Corynebacterium glutamicum]|uniref:aspartate:alanine exchanger family transporter n=1 Tax=Corynebacterium glutamicum TaxID=1718 RepID=UPI000744959D|nr:aspartate:alanine exchanger family transporter [Corynebacterium glutamicum]AMA00674.1 transporter [Corynebacterium glutamicum]